MLGISLGIKVACGGGEGRALGAVSLPIKLGSKLFSGSLLGSMLGKTVPLADVDGSIVDSVKLGTKVSAGYTLGVVLEGTFSITDVVVLPDGRWLGTVLSSKSTVDKLRDFFFSRIHLVNRDFSFSCLRIEAISIPSFLLHHRIKSGHQFLDWPKNQKKIC